MHLSCQAERGASDVFCPQILCRSVNIDVACAHVRFFFKKKYKTFSPRTPSAKCESVRVCIRGAYACVYEFACARGRASDGSRSPPSLTPSLPPCPGQLLYDYLEAFGDIEFEQFEVATNLPKVVYSDRSVTLGPPPPPQQVRL